MRYLVWNSNTPLNDSANISDFLEGNQNRLINTKERFDQVFPHKVCNKKIALLFELNWVNEKAPYNSDLGEIFGVDLLKGIRLVHSCTCPILLLSFLEEKYLRNEIFRGNELVESCSFLQLPYKKEKPPLNPKVEFCFLSFEDTIRKTLCSFLKREYRLRRELYHRRSLFMKLEDLEQGIIDNTFFQPCISIKPRLKLIECCLEQLIQSSRTSHEVRFQALRNDILLLFQLLENVEEQPNETIRAIKKITPFLRDKSLLYEQCKK